MVNRHLAGFQPPSTKAADQAQWATAAKKTCRSKPLTPLITVKAANTSAWKWLRAREGSKDVDNLRKSLQSAKRVKVERSSLRSLAAGRPGAALVAQLVLAQRYPKDTSALLNVASLLTTLGRPREAHPYLTAAVKGKARPTVAGIPGTAVELNVRGWVLLGLGRHREAAKVFAASWKLSKALSETATGAALAAQCGKNSKTSAVWRARAGTRGEKVTSVGASQSDSPVPRPDILKLLPSTGQPLARWTVELPATIGDVTSERRDEAGQLRNESAFVRLPALREQAAKVWERARARDQANFNLPNRVRWRSGVTWMASYTENLPELAELRQAEATAFSYMSDQLDVQGFWMGGEYSTPRSYECAPAKPEFLKTMDALFIWFTVHQELARADYEQKLRASQLFEDPLLREYVRIKAVESAEFYRSMELSWTHQALSLIAQFAHCGSQTGQAWAGEVGSISAFTAGSDIGCPAMFKLRISLEVYTVTASCEKWTFTVASPGPAAGFVSAEQAWGANSVTFFAGGQLKAGVAAVSATARAGIYLTVGSRGVTDAGVRAQISGALTDDYWQISGSPSVQKSFMVPAGPLQPYD